MKTLTVVIPALNEEEGIGPVIREIPVARLNDMQYDVEILVVDNGSTDKTPHIAREHGATVVHQPERGYGNAYKAGFANARGDIIATGDADLTYPFEDLPEILEQMEREDLDFINTDRLSTLNREAMSGSHRFGNRLLAVVMRTLYGAPFRDSQSGMWIFKREIWPELDVQSPGMPFSQEIKIEAHAKGFKCAEVPITYRARVGGEVKLSTVKDGARTMTNLVRKRAGLQRVKPAARAKTTSKPKAKAKK